MALYWRISMRGEYGPRASCRSCRGRAMPFDTRARTAASFRCTVMPMATPPYKLRVWAYHPERNLLRSAYTTVTTRATQGELKGTVRNGGQKIANALLSLDEAALSTRTDPEGAFLFRFVPTGKHALRVDTAD